MADDDTPRHEGWSVAQRPLTIAALGVPVLLLTALLVAGWFYDRDLRPAAHRVVTTFSAPGVEAFIHDGTRDPHRPPTPPHVDRSVEAAKRAVVASGLPGFAK